MKRFVICCAIALTSLTPQAALAQPNSFPTSHYSSFPLRSGYGVAIGALSFSPQSLPGKLGVDYFMEPKADYQYLASHGATFVRIPFLWERLQPRLYGPLQQKYLGLIIESVRRAQASHLKVVLDMHNFGSRVIAGKQTQIGTPQLSTGAFADAWRRLIESVPKHSVTAIDLMNEPGQLPRRVGWPAGPVGNTLTLAVDSAIDAIRKVNKYVWILVPTEGFQAAQSFTLYYGPKPHRWWKDIYGRSAVSVHYYLDLPHVGAYVTPWSSQLRNRIKPDLSALLKWGQRSKTPIFFGELGVPVRSAGQQNFGDVGRWESDFRSVVELAHLHGAAVTQWAAGSHYRSPTSTEPIDETTGTVDYSLTSPQLTILREVMSRPVRNRN